MEVKISWTFWPREDTWEEIGVLSDLSFFARVEDLAELEEQNVFLFIFLFLSSYKKNILFSCSRVGLPRKPTYKGGSNGQS